jgi:hypothetical protein
MPVVRGRDYHRIYVGPGKDLAIIGEVLALMIFSIQPAALLVNVANCHDLTGIVILPGILHEGFADRGAPSAAANQRNIDSIIRPYDTAGVHLASRSRKSASSDGKACAHTARPFQKITAINSFRHGNLFLGRRALKRWSSNTFECNASLNCNMSGARMPV